MEYSFAESSAHFLLRLFFGAVKSFLIIFVFVVCVLVASQSSVAPVSLRLLSSYGMEYAVATFKPYRHYFPEPFLIELETK
jgi:hypothetical protein